MRFAERFTTVLTWQEKPERLRHYGARLLCRPQFLKLLLCAGKAISHALAGVMRKGLGEK